MPTSLYMDDFGFRFKIQAYVKSKNADVHGWFFTLDLRLRMPLKLKIINGDSIAVCGCFKI